MKIVIDTENGVLMLTASNYDEECLLRSIRQKLRDREFLKYAGRSSVTPNDPLSARMLLRFWFAEEKITISATSDQDELSIRHLRDAIFFGGGGLYLLGDSPEYSATTLKFCVEFCKQCQSPVIDMASCEHSICNRCAERCQHEYKGNVPIHGGKIQLGFSEVCTKCGRVNPQAKVEVVVGND